MPGMYPRPTSRSGLSRLALKTCACAGPSRDPAVTPASIIIAVGHSVRRLRMSAPCKYRQFSPPLRVITECFGPQLPVACGGNASKYISVSIGDLHVAGPQWVPYMDLYMYLDILVYLDRGGGLAAL